MSVLEEKKLLFLIVTTLLTAILACLVFILLRPPDVDRSPQDTPRLDRRNEEPTSPVTEEEPTSAIPEGSTLWRFFLAATVLVSNDYHVVQADAGGVSALLVYKEDREQSVTLNLLSARDFETNEIVPFDEMIVRQMDSFPREMGCAPMSVDDVAFVCRRGIDAQGVDRLVYFGVYDDENYLSLSWPTSVTFANEIIKNLNFYPTEEELFGSQVPAGL